MGSPFDPNEVPAPVLQRRCPSSLTESVRSWRGITFRRLMKDSRFGMKKAGHSADTTSCFFQAQEWRFGVVRLTTKNEFWKIEQLHKILFVKKKNTAHAAQRWILSGESAAKWIGCVAGRLIFQGWSTARLCPKWTRPHLVDGFKPIHKSSGICDREYHALNGASR